MGRVGRDGYLFDELIMYKSNKNYFKRVESEFVWLVKDDSKCRYEFLCEVYFLFNKKILLFYDCCEVCEKSCDCKSDLCFWRYEYFKIENEDSVLDFEDEMIRFVSDKEKKLIYDKLVFYKL